MKHQETHPELDVEGCFGCKIATVSMGTAHLRMERNGTDATGGRGTAQYVKDMYERRRAAGLPDPEPENAKAARYAPKKGIFV